MARVTSAVTKRRRHKKILKQAKGYFGHKHIGFRTAKEQVRKSNEYAFRDRKQVKREMRKLWIKRINAATRIYETSYSKFMNGLKKAEIEINRKMLADIAVNELEQFGYLVNEARKALGMEEVNVAEIAKGFDAPASKPAKKEKPAPKAKPEPKVEEAKVEEVKEEAKDELDTVSDEAEAEIVKEAIDHAEESVSEGKTITEAVEEAVEEVIEETKEAVAEEEAKAEEAKAEDKA